MKRNYIILILLAIILVTIYFIYANNSSNESNEAEVSTTVSDEELEAIINEIAPIERNIPLETPKVDLTDREVKNAFPPSPTPSSSGSTAGSSASGKYVDYKSKDEVVEFAKRGTAILFFHAGWCPTCRNFNTNITNDLSNIPPDIAIYKVDYDSNSDLRRRFEVRRQHTFVIVDDEFNLKKKWSGSRDISELISNL